MDIFINEHKVQFEIENESNLFEVLKGVEKWGEDKDLMIASYKVNDEPEQYLNSEDNRSIAVDEINKVSLSMCSHAEYMFQSSKDLKSFVLEFKSKIKEANEDNRLAAFDWITQSIQKFLNIFKFANQAVILESLKDIKIALHNDSPSVLDELSNQFTVLEQFIQRLTFKAWVYYLHNLLKSTSSKTLTLIKDEMQTLIGELIGRVSSISESIQTGKDEEAMGALEDLTEAYQVLIMYFEKKKISDIELEGVKGEQVLQDIKSILSDIESSLNREDMIEVSDLIEYEFGGKLEEVKKFIEAS